ncbi:hypothetical protein [Xylanibacillus composti]|uniref:Uncharacterized protein n=1 Tax=Xylanibacillus composti TaxID=1572762 RepID=A0A8J4H4M5_9BACL|nr:hypothetical protein [Xylanibacillus composti]GIQ70769.1 hypothetical protein XYCOK13_35930 [Xylanibacillus composti]
MEEQQIREIIREELAEFKKTIQPIITLNPTVQFCDVDADTDQLVKMLRDKRIPDKPWG